MTARLVNFALFFDTLALLASGILLFTTGRAQDAWLYTLHRYTGAALLVLLVPKTRIILRSLARAARRGQLLKFTNLIGLSLTALLLVSLALVLAWTLDLAPFYLDVIIRYITPLGLHWYVGFALFPFFAWHALQRWPLPRRRAARPAAGGMVSPAKIHLRLNRREALSLIGVSVLGLLGGGALDALAGTRDRVRRFTGSRLLDSMQGNNFPVTNSDGPPVIDLVDWKLRVSGRVGQPFELAYADLLALTAMDLEATIDCTLGWASTQIWHGVGVTQLLDRAGILEGARQVTFQATNGASAVFGLDEARETLIATHVGTEPLTLAHGFPARLVAPRRRGYHWIKWMSELVVS